MRIVPGSDCSPEERRQLAIELIRAFGSQYPQWTVDEATTELAGTTGFPRSLIALVDGQAVGCASLLDDDEVTDWPDRFWLGNVVVRDAYRGRGVGAALVRAVEDLARELRITELHLVTDTSANWYERAGWTALGVADVHGRPMTVMHKTLVPVPTRSRE